MIFKHINKVGVELEGGWRSRKDRHPGFRGDSSVSVYNDRDWHYEHNDDCEDDCELDNRIQGEYVSEPSSVLELSQFIQEHYPDDIDESCGMHVHFSFVKEGLYGTMMEPRFYGYFLRRMEAFGRAKQLPKSHSFWNRLQGKNSYCCNNRKSSRVKVGYRDLASKQILDRSRNETRYHHLNFCKALHNTLEVRMLPMFDTPEQAVAAMQYLAVTIESYLNKRKRQKVFKTVLEYEEQTASVNESEIDLGKELICAS